MVKRLFCFLLSICIIFYGVFCVFGYDSQKNPSLTIYDDQGELYVGEIYRFNIDVENLRLINNCSIIISYNPDVLEYIEEPATDTGEPRRYSYDIQQDEKEGRIIVSISEYDKSISYIPEKVSMLSPRYNVVKEGNTDFSVEIVKTDCKNEAELMIDDTSLLDTAYCYSSETFLDYNENSLIISGTGLISLPLLDYDINKVITDNSDSIYKVIIEEGISKISYEAILGLYDQLPGITDIYLPDSLVSFPYSNDIFKKAIIHGNGMTVSESIATKHKLKFELNEETMIGDTDLNKVLDSNDALDILKMAARLKTLYKWTGDVDENNVVDAGDALKVLKIAARITE